MTDQRAAADFAAKQRGKGYLYWGDSPWCRCVESEDAAKCTLFAADRMVTDSKDALLQSLTEDEKALAVYKRQGLRHRRCQGQHGAAERHQRRARGAQG